MDIGARIRELRKSKNLTTRDLANMADISQPVISRLENNTRSADVELIKRICEAIGITLAEFFADTLEVEPLPIDLQQILETSKQLTPVQRELIVNVMKEIIKDNKEMGD